MKPTGVSKWANLLNYTRPGRLAVNLQNRKKRDFAGDISMQRGVQVLPRTMMENVVFCILPRIP